MALTERGRAVGQEAMAAHMACESRLATALSDEDQRALARLLRQLLIGMEGNATEEEAQ